MGSSSVTIGYVSRANWSMGCAKRLDFIDKIWYGGRLAWEGFIDESGFGFIDNKNLFGGDEVGGGLYGQFYVHFGREGETLPINVSGAMGYDFNNAPNLNGFVSIHFLNCEVIAISKSVREVQISGGWYPTHVFGQSNNEEGSVNPASLMYDILTRNDGDKWVRNPFSTDRLVTESFQAGYDYFAENGGYVSATFTEESEAEEIITQIQDISNTVLVSNRQGKIELVVFQPPTEQEIENAFMFDKSTIDNASIADVKNDLGANQVGSVQVTYKRLDEDYSRSYVARSTRDSNGETEAVSIDNPLIDNSDTAANYANMEVVKRSASNINADITVSTAVENLPQEGDIALFNLSALYDNSVAEQDQIGDQILIVRVLERKGSLLDEKVTFSVTEDIFTRAGQTNFVSPEVTPPTPVDQIPITTLQFEDHINAPYFAMEIVPLTGSELIKTDATQGMVMSFGVNKPNEPVLTIEQYAEIGTSYTRMTNAEPCRYGVISGALNKDSSQIQFSSVGNSFESFDVDVSVVAYAAGEFFLIEVPIGSTATDIFYVGRGLFDTIPTAIPSGTVCFFLGITSDNAGDWCLAQPLFFTGQSVKTKLLGRSTSKLTNINDATAFTATINARQYLPLPAAAINHNGNFYNSTRENDGSDTIVGFFCRNRTLQRFFLPNAWGEFVGNAPEFGQKFLCEAYSDGVPVKSEVVTPSGSDEQFFTLSYQEEIDALGELAEELTVNVTSYREEDDGTYYALSKPQSIKISTI